MDAMTVATLQDVAPPVGARSRQYGLLDPRLPPEERKVPPRTDGPPELPERDAHSDHERQRHRADTTREPDDRRIVLQRANAITRRASAIEAFRNVQEGMQGLTVDPQAKPPKIDPRKKKSDMGRKGCGQLQSETTNDEI